MTPSTPLGPFEDNAIAWTTWVTLMGSLGLCVLALLAGPVARRLGGPAVTASTRRLARIAALLSLLAVPSVLADVAHGLSETGGYDYSGAWDSIFDGTNGGRLLGIELTATLAGLLLLVPLTLRPVAAGRWRGGLLGGAATAGAVALGTTKFPDAVPDDWGRTVFETVMWMLHLLGGAVWLGGLVGLLALALPGGLERGERGAFFGPVIRRFSLTAMSAVAAIALSGLFLYWEHVDGLNQLVSTMYGRTLGLKILIFGAILLLGVVNQFWLHPRLEALRAGGDERPLLTILAREFRLTVAVETVLLLAVLFVAPFLHGSARNQAFQAAQARHGVALDELTRLTPKQADTSTWVWGTAETLVVIAVMVAGYRYSARIAERRAVPVPGRDRVLVDTP